MKLVTGRFKLKLGFYRHSQEERKKGTRSRIPRVRLARPRQPYAYVHASRTASQVQARVLTHPEEVPTDNRHHSKWHDIAIAPLGLSDWKSEQSVRDAAAQDLDATYWTQRAGLDKPAMISRALSRSRVLGPDNVLLGRDPALTRKRCKGCAS